MQNAPWLKDEAGSATVDWVVATASVVALALGAIAVYGNGFNQAADTLEQRLIEAEARQ